MPCEFHAVVKHAADFQAAIFGHPVDEEMSGAPNAAGHAVHMIAAVAKVVGACAFRQLVAFHAPNAMRIGDDVQNGLDQQLFVTQANLFAEL